MREGRECYSVTVKIPWTGIIWQCGIATNSRTLSLSLPLSLSLSLTVDELQVFQKKSFWMKGFKRTEPSLSKPSSSSSSSSSSSQVSLPTSCLHARMACAHIYRYRLHSTLPPPPHSGHLNCIFSDRLSVRAFVCRRHAALNFPRDVTCRSGHGRSEAQRIYDTRPETKARVTSVLIAATVRIGSESRPAN